MHPTTYNAKAYSAASDTSPLASTKIKRRDPTDRDVQIEILFCGMPLRSPFGAQRVERVHGHELPDRPRS